jgi:hypothetical protein
VICLSAAALMLPPSDISIYSRQVSILTSHGVTRDKLHEKHLPRITPPARTVYFLPVRLSTTVSVPRPPPGSGRSACNDVLGALQCSRHNCAPSCSEPESITLQLAVS